MNEKTIKQTSRFLSLVLRHRPELIHLRPDQAGWVSVTELLERAQAKLPGLNLATLEIIVAENDKKRFSFSDDGQQIRANQGHSFPVDLGYTPIAPPAHLYHGTATRFVDSIFAKGLQKQKRHHVHLSSDQNTASKVGLRYGKLALLLIDTQKMYESGHIFYCTDNGVWLTDHVPAEYISNL